MTRTNSVNQLTTIVAPASVEEAVQEFGDGTDVCVFGGGTILMPQMRQGRLHSPRVLFLNQAGLDTWDEADEVTLGAMLPVSVIANSGLEPLASAARELADYEVRAQATIGGNLCCPRGRQSPPGDLQAPLVALGAQVYSAGPGGEQSEPVESFLARDDGDRLVLSLSLKPATRAAHLSHRRAHAHGYAVMSVSAAEVDGAIRVAAGVAGPAARLQSVERAISEGASIEAAADAARSDVAGADDAIASAWYRERLLPVLVRRVLRDLEMGR
jgi:CO/xanthine dehydrogenase FAD-binding subunit